MKRKLLLFFLLFLCTLVLPVFALFTKKAPTGNDASSTPNSQSGSVSTTPTAFHVEGVGEIPVEDYIVGVLCSEMPALYEREAHKAQAVAAYTYALNYLATTGDTLPGGNTTLQRYLTPAQYKEMIGEKADEYLAEFKKIAAEVKNQALYYDGKPIFAAYHSISSGKTEKGEVFFNGTFPYLASVDSSTDETEEGFAASVVLTQQELTEKLKVAVADITFSGDPAGYIKILSFSSIGSVLEVQVCNKTLTGLKVREALGLRSPVFSVSYANGLFTFTTKGYGHGVGMSQHGANALAKQGKTYKEILAHYYPGTELKTI